MIDYQSLTLKSDVISYSSVDSFVKPDIESNHLGSLISKVKDVIINPSIFGTKTTLTDNTAPIICVAWHPTESNKVAFGMSDGVVQVVLLPSTKPIFLRNQHQHNITCVAWQPNSNKTISVGSSSGVFVWEVTSLPKVSSHGSSMPSRTSLVPTADPVSSLSFTPEGRHCLVTTTTSFLVMDCIRGDSPAWIRAIKHPAFVLASSQYCFSLLADGLRFQVLRGVTEGVDSYTRLQAPVKAAVWTPSASHVFFATAQSSLVLSLEIFNPKEVNSKVSAEAEVCIDLHKTMCYSEGESWEVQQLTMTDCGERLALLATDSAASKVFIFGLTLHPLAVFEADVIANLNPTCISYQHNSKLNSVLCLCCENGSVEFIPQNTKIES